MRVFTRGPPVRRSGINPVGFRDISLSQSSRWTSGPKARRSPPECALASPAPCSTPVETFTDAERARLAPHFTNLDRPVFALVNLPETVKGALFARYSRYQGTLRRLFLDEFADSLPERPRPGTAPRAERAAELYERIFLGYGDDSVAQLGGAHVACEWVSNVLTKVLQRPRLAAYLEQSTRYIAYDAPMPGGGYRYYRDPELGPQLRARDGRGLRRSTPTALPRVTAWVDERVPRRRRRPRARRAIQAKALDLLRGLLPAASLSHMGIYASGQTYEQLILHLLAHPLPEARRYGQMILEAVQAVMPSFVTRVERPDRGGEWVAYLEGRERAADRWVRRLGLDREAERRRARPSVRLLHVDGDEDALLAALLFEAAGVGEEETRIRLAALSARRARRAARPTSSACAPTAATARAAASRRCATASRSSRTTAPSATCSATGC